MTSLPPPILVAPILRRACLESNRNPLLESHLCSLRTGSLFVPWKQVSGTGEGEAVFVLGSWYPPPPAMSGHCPGLGNLASSAWQCLARDFPTCHWVGHLA